MTKKTETGTLNIVFFFSHGEQTVLKESVRSAVLFAVHGEKPLTKQQSLPVYTYKRVNLYNRLYYITTEYMYFYVHYGLLQKTC